ncbi:MAG: hypothetical protein CLLPBCKN_005135 [Chroococcidiopsis cubana SAG 39.79]|nr:hypothetical protein [Chroococcidiopsis cubana SAG 39.79]MDZ4874510.1 hypothetical protein [Chroococcidiopsis cubana SAG 39.79]MDZ4875715.1 hypothetical protein [Chroococcidiopsis cubana SAG 39.79]
MKHQVPAAMPLVLRIGVVGLMMFSQGLSNVKNFAFILGIVG